MHTCALSVVCHVSWGGAEFGIGLDDLVNGFQEVFLCGDLPPSSDGKHARLCAHAADLGAWQEIAHESKSAYRTAFSGTSRKYWEFIYLSCKGLSVSG